MKKLLIIPALLALTLFSVYHHKIEGKKIYEQPTIIEKMEQNILMEQGEIYTTKKEKLYLSIVKVEKALLQMLFQISSTENPLRKEID